MTLNLALSSAVSSLLVVEKQMGVASNNIANANTVGYTKETVQVAERVAGGIGTGVSDLGTVNNVDQFLQAAVMQANAQSTQATAFNTYYQNLQNALGQISTGTSGGNNLASELSSLQTTLNQLANTPENSSLSTTAVGQLDTLAANLRSLSQQVQQLRSNADSQISQVVGDVNTQLDTIARLNKGIAQASATGQPIASLSDQRATALQTLSGDLGVSSFVDSNGNLQIYTAGGQPLLVGNTANHLSHTPSTLNASITYVAGGSGGISGIMVGGTDITNQLSTGTLAAVVQQRDTELPNAQNALNVLAQKLSSTVNPIYNLAVPASALTTSLSSPANLNGATALTIAPGTTARVGLLDSKGNVTRYVDVDLSAAATVNGVQAAINNVLTGTNPPMGTATLTGSAPTQTLTLQAPSGSAGINITTLTGGIMNGNQLQSLSSYFGLTPVQPQTNLITGGNSASTIAVAPAILANPAVNFANGNGTMAAMLSNALLANQNFSAATATGMAVQPTATVALGNTASSVTINGGTAPVTVNIPAGASLNSIATAINAAGSAAGITAVVVGGNGSYQLQISASGAQLTFANTSGTLLQTLGLSSSPIGYLASVSTTFAGFATNLTSDIAGRANEAKNQQTSKQTTLTAMQQNLSAQDGVNVDEETAQLAALQNLYAASARVVTTVNSMFQSLLQAVGA